MSNITRKTFDSLDYLSNAFGRTKKTAFIERGGYFLVFNSKFEVYGHNNHISVIACAYGHCTSWLDRLHFHCQNP
jgi:hypothetical protein